ncbi:putative histidine kinase [Candidatus Kuenenia stuttgartiensis]|uniref:histidine kinase n=1 Tax=Kuenenia stuttgartiensis TaxID=174633 RepID=Q1Q7M0_KUEST|nr:MULTISPECIES: HAMP domain-containing sensor histidine kinase [Kuenenia]MBZ0190369.1 HAMP domain-containing protein [Candidatus Kuenenia stuttgartiensis]MCF6152852.1 sensor histidine kinase [Candidatus Kuenenia stuttgartiensis]MCL4727073.1 HAMP domain-containing protein [Candidatus Kuenenia stuttgartiensis]MCZ7622524.1 ATP-binding protein [Candidatus Kuenenia sp.]QII13432.1 putative histidine kinase [Candidatus Kuenenia stuttgartiensis]
MKKNHSTKNSIRIKLLITMISLIVGLLTVLTFIQISTQKIVLKKEFGRRIELMKNNLVEKGKILSDNLARQTENNIASYNFSNAAEILNKTVHEYQELDYIILMDSSCMVYTHTLHPELQQEKLSGEEDLFAASRRNPTIYEFSRNTTSFMEIIIPISVSTEQWGTLRLGFSLNTLNNEILNSRNEIRKKIEEMVLRSVLTSILFVVIGVIIVYILSTRLSKPIVKLTESARLLANGNFTAALNLKITSKDEIGILAASFIEMSNNLKASYEKLEEYSHTLQQKVEDRTRELKDANQKLQDLDKAKSGFLSTVSHELRTPLTAIIGFTNIIKKRLDTFIFPQIETNAIKSQKAIQQIKENINIILSEGERLTNLINDVLDLAKIEAGKIEWKRHQTSVTEVIMNATAATTALIEQKGLALNVDIEKNIPDFYGDKNRFIQVVINLISNAIKFTDKGAISCYAKQTDNKIQVTVMDTGVGIAPENLEKIFDKFKQVGDTLTNKPGGTGLGLPICKQIVEYHGGSIHAESEPNKGTAFSFTIPLRADV